MIDFTKVKVHEAPRWVVVGDVHGCAHELAVMRKLLDDRYGTSQYGFASVGDLVDRGPHSIVALSLMTQVYGATVVRGNHDDKFGRWLKGNPVKINGGLDATILEYEQFLMDGHDLTAIEQAVQELPFFTVLKNTIDDSYVILVHAAILPWMINAEFDGLVRKYCLYGEVHGEIGPDGYPVRSMDWIEKWAEYDNISVVYGHTPVVDIDRRGNTYNVDTGCVFGGKLTAFDTVDKSVAAEVRSVKPHAHRPGWETFYPIANDG